MIGRFALVFFELLRGRVLPVFFLFDAAGERSVALSLVDVESLRLLRSA